MPEINSKRNNNKKKQGAKRKRLSPRSKKNGTVTSAGIDWESTGEVKEEAKYTKKQMYAAMAIIFCVFLFILWAFVDDRPEWQRVQQHNEQMRRDNATMQQQRERDARNAALASYNNAELLNSTTLSVNLQSMQTGEDDRIVVVTFDDSTREEAAGNVYKLRLFKKMDGIAKRIAKHKLFKRYEEDEVPRFVLFDCGDSEDASAASVCKQIVGESLPNILVFRPQAQPRTLPSELKSDRDIISYLYDLTQPAVKYLEELLDAEAFVADDSEMHAMLFTDAADSSGVMTLFDEVSDSLRDFAKFGRTKNPSVVESFDLDEAQLPALLVWRTFGENPQVFAGNLSNKEVVRDFVMNNFVPIFGEFNQVTSKRFMKRGLPMLWVAYNDKMQEDAFQLLLNSALSSAKRYKGQLTFVQLDVDAQPQIAQNFGLTVRDKPEKEEDEDEDDVDDEDDDEEVDLPQVFIMNQVAQVKEIVDMDDIEGTIQKVIDDYLLQIRIQRGDVMSELHDDAELEDDDDDDEFEEDDDEDDDEEDDDDESEQDEQDKQEDQPPNLQKQQRPKTDL